MHRVNGVDQAVAAGSVFALTPADFHEVRASSGSDLTYYNVVVEPGAWDERAERLFREGLLAGLRGRLPAATVYPELEPDLPDSGRSRPRAAREPLR